MKELKTISNLINDFNAKYSLTWFLECKSKFQLIPDNLHNSSVMFMANIQYLIYENDTLKEVLIQEEYTLYDFCYGLKDIYTGHLQENKFETVGEFEDGYPKEILIKGEEFINTLPDPSLIIWKKELLNCFEKNLSFCKSPQDEIKYLQFEISHLKELIKSYKASSEYVIIIGKFISTEIIKPLENKYEFAQERNLIINHDETKTAILFNLSNAQFCKLFFYLVEKGIIDYENNPTELSELLSKSIKTKHKGKFKSPHPISIARAIPRGSEFIFKGSLPKIEDFISSLTKE